MYLGMLLNTYVYYFLYICAIYMYMCTCIYVFIYRCMYGIIMYECNNVAIYVSIYASSTYVCTQVYIYIIDIFMYFVSMCINSVSRLVAINAGGNFLGVCDQKIHIIMCPILDCYGFMTV